MPVECCSFQIQSTLFVDDHTDTVAINLAIGRVVKLIVWFERVAETAAAAGRDADAQKHGLIKFLILPNAANFVCCFFGNSNRHWADSSENGGGNHLLLQTFQELTFQPLSDVDWGHAFPGRPGHLTLLIVITGTPLQRSYSIKSAETSEALECPDWTIGQSSSAIRVRPMAMSNSNSAGTSMANVEKP